MEIKKLYKTLTLVAALAVSGFAIAENAVAQTIVPSPRFRNQPLEEPEATAPFAELGSFQYDAQVFAPLEFTNGKQIEPQNGFFFTFDKTYLSIGGGNVSSDGFQTVTPGGDYQWGNRYELGYFTDNDQGWDLVYLNSEGITFVNGQDTLVANPTLVTTKFNSFELNKIFRQTISDGRYFEPYVGLRYLGVSDSTIEDTIVTVGAAVFDNRFVQRATNNAGGIHAGAKINRRSGRWRSTFDGSLATTYNQRNYFASDVIIDGAGNIGVSESSDSESGFVPALDASFEVSYNVTRDIAFRSGVTALYLWDGITRVNTLPTPLNPNSVNGAGGDTGIIDDSITVVGFTFGFEWRR